MPGVTWTMDSARRIARVVRKVERLSPDPGRVSDWTSRWRPPFLAKITGWELLAPNRWKYSWAEQELVLDAFGDKLGGLSGTLGTDYALNTMEANNTARGGRQGNGVNQGGSAYPAGFNLQPIGGANGTAVGNPAVVVMQLIVDEALAPRFIFSEPNADDGTCT